MSTKLYDFPRLSREEEGALITKIRAFQVLCHDTPLSEVQPDTLDPQMTRLFKQALRCRDRLVTHNMGLCYDLAINKYKGRGVPVEDLAHAGSIGLVKAAERYDPSYVAPNSDRPARFGTYAYWWVKQELTKAVQTQGRTIRLPQNVIDDQIQLTRLEREHPNATVETLSALMECKPAYIYRLQHLQEPILSIDYNHGQDDYHVIETGEVDAGIETLPDRDLAVQYLDYLNGAQRTVMAWTYGIPIDGQEAILMDTEEIAISFNVGVSRVKSWRRKASDLLERIASGAVRPFIQTELFPLAEAA